MFVHQLFVYLLAKMKKKKIILTSIVQKFFPNTFWSISKLTKTILNKTFCGGSSHRCSKYFKCLHQPLTLTVPMEWRSEFIMISAGCVWCYESSRAWMIFGVDEPNHPCLIGLSWPESNPTSLLDLDRLKPINMFHLKTNIV